MRQENSENQASKETTYNILYNKIREIRNSGLHTYSHCPLMILGWIASGPTDLN